MSDFVTVIDYLDSTELESFKGRLNGTNIKYVVRGHDAKSRYTSAYFEIQVPKDNFKEAKLLADNFRSAKAKKMLKCPKCESDSYEKITNLNFLQKIYYWGTTPVKCRKCKTKFII